MLKADEVQGIWAAHLEFCRQHRGEWRLHRAAFETRFWEAGQPWGLPAEVVREKLQFLVELNRIEPFLTMLGSDLFVALPRLVVGAPQVVEATVGRPADRTGKAEAMRTLGEEWLKRESIREIAINAYRMALIYGSSAIRLGPNENGATPLDTLWMEAVPPWDALWDRRASRGTERYRGHAKMRLLSEAERIVGASIDGVTPIALPDVAMEGYSLRSRTHPSRPYDGYVRLLELYDLVDGEQAFFVCDGTDQTPVIHQVGATSPMPWDLGNGEPGVPLLPVVLLHPPDLPLRGIAPVRRIMQVNMEQNLGTTIVMNAARRDAARTVMTKPGVFTDESVTRIHAGLDLEVVEVAHEDVNLAGDVMPFPTPPLPSSIGQMFSVLESGWRDVQGTSDIQQGRQQSYVSAREAGLLAAYGERAVSDLQAAMYKVLSGATALFFVALAAKGSAVSVVVNGERVQIPVKEMEGFWHVAVADAGTTPASAEAKLADFVSMQPDLMTLASVAAGRPAQDGQPPAPEIVRLAQLMMDFIVRQKGFPEAMTWSSLAEAVGGMDRLSPDDVAAALSTPVSAAGVAPLPPGLGVPGVE